MLQCYSALVYLCIGDIMSIVSLYEHIENVTFQLQLVTRVTFVYTSSPAVYFSQIHRTAILLLLAPPPPPLLLNSSAALPISWLPGNSVDSSLTIWLALLQESFLTISHSRLGFTSEAEA